MTPFVTRARAVCILATMILPAALQANPKGGQVKAGSASFEGGENSLTIRQSSDRGIIHWEDFSIGKGETTRFIQPSAKSATLNRVVGNLPSTIAGSLEANGSVYLVNRNGILVGPTGRINTASFVASTLDVPDAEFLAGSNMHFKGNSTAGVVNLGTITAANGDVVLLGHTVQNAGTISAPNGVVALGAGDDIVLQVAGDERIVVNAGVATGGTGVTNSGTIQAAQAELKAAGGNVYALAVNNTGIVRATGITQRNGRVLLGAPGGVVQNTGRLSARNVNGSGGHVQLNSGKGGHTIQNGVIDASGAAGQIGGTIELLGDTVSVGASSLLDVSGASAGLVAIGVDAATASQATAEKGIDAVIGGAPDATQITAAQRTTIETGSRILANATAAGSGGHVVVWSELRSVVGGEIEAKGGELGGDGGLVETSGHEGLSITTGTRVVAGAARGRAGTWLMDPAGISIDAGPTDASVSTYSSPPESDYNQNALVNHVAASDIVAALSGGSNVLVATSSSYANKDIEVNAAINTGVLSVNSTTHLAPILSLNAGTGAIDIKAQIGGAGTNLIFQAQTVGGGVTVEATGSVIASGISITSGGLLTVAGLLSSINDNTMYLRSGLGGITFTGTGQARTTTNASMFLDTSATATATITDAGTTSIVTGGLGINAGAKGVGTSANPLHISASHFDATVNDNGLTTGNGGGVYVSNSGGNLHIAGSDPHNVSGTSFTGIAVPNITGFGGVEVTNTGGDVLVDDPFVDSVTAYGDIKLTASSASSVKIKTVGPDSVHSFHGSVELDAGADVIVGDGITAGVNVRGAASVTVNAGAALVVSGSILKAGGGNGINIITGGDITVQQVSGSDGRIGTSGGVGINLTTGTTHQVFDNGGSTGGISTLLEDDTSSAVTAAGAPIFIKTDGLTLGAQLNAGQHGSINIRPVSLHWGINLGTTAKDVNGELGLSSAELGRITAGAVDLFTDATNDGLVHVTGAVALTNANLTQLTLESNGGSGIVIAQTLDVNANELVLTATNNGAVTGAGNIRADTVTVSAPGAGVNLTGVINTTALTFHTQSTAKFTNAANQIDKINASTTGAQGISLATTGNLAIAGAVSTTGQALLVTGGNLTINSGASVAGAAIILDVSHGNLINLAGASALNGDYIVYLNQLGTSQLNGLTGTSYTTAPVVPYNNPLSPAPDVFYYRNLTAPPVQPPASGGGSSDVAISSPRLFSAVAEETPDQKLKDFRKYLFSLSLSDLVKLLADPAILADPAKRNELQAQVGALNTITRNPLTQAQQDSIVAQAAREIQAKAASILTQKQAVLSSILSPTILDMSDPATQGAFSGQGLTAWLGNINLGAFSIDQLSQLSRAQVLAMLGSAGVKLQAADRTTALSATMTEAQLSNIIKSGNGISVPQFTSLIASGGGNLTVNQIVASGAGNLISQDGGGLISQDGGGFSVVDRFGKLISQDGGGLTVFALAKLISQDGGGIVSHDAGGIVSHDAGGIVSHDAGGIVSHDAGGIVSHDAGGIVSHDAGGIVSHDAGGLISQNGGGILSLVVSLISQDGGGITAGRNQLISQDGGGLLQNAAGFGNSLMKFQ